MNVFLSVSAPPTPHGGKRYAAFLSHKKAEAAAEARYLNDMLQLLLSTDIFLDSSNLGDLRALYEDGLAQAECVVLIASASVLHSPWCLMELHEAAQVRHRERCLPRTHLLTAGVVLLCRTMCGSWARPS